MVTMQDIETHIQGSSLAIRPPVEGSVEEVVQNVALDLDGVRPYKTNIKEWLKPIVDLSDFYAYPTNGITEGLNYWLATEKRNIVTITGDYQWVMPRSGVGGDILYMSNPSAITGNWVDIPTHCPVALDLAYAGSTAPHHIKLPDNVEYVFYSLSKSFGLRNVRTGWWFTRKPFPPLELLIGSGKYYNVYAHDVAEAVIDKFTPCETYRYFHHVQHDICGMMDFTPSDSVWLATSSSPKYEKFKRNSDVARINLSGLYHEITH